MFGTLVRQTTAYSWLGAEEHYLLAYWRLGRGNWLNRAWRLATRRGTTHPSRTSVAVLVLRIRELRLHARPLEDELAADSKCPPLGRDPIQAR
jgi:hypothetical protein